MNFSSLTKSRYGLSSSPEYSTESEHTTTDTSIHDSSHTSDNQDSFTTHDSFISDHSFSMVESLSSESSSLSELSSESEFERGSDISRSDENLSMDMSVKIIYDDDIYVPIPTQLQGNSTVEDIDPLPTEFQVNNTVEDINEENQITIDESEYELNGSAFESDDHFIDLTYGVNDFENDSITSEVESSLVTDLSPIRESPEVTDEVGSIDEIEWDVTPTSLDVPRAVPPSTSRSSNLPFYPICSAWSLQEL